MMARNWKKFCVIAVNALLLAVSEQVVNACADGGDPGDYYPSFFDSRLPSSGSFEPFRYSALTGILYEDWYEGDSTFGVDTADGNRAEWAAFTGVPLPDVDSFVYSYERPILASLYEQIEKNTGTTLPEPYQSNRMTQWFRRSKDLEALGYLMYAKQIEPYANRTPADPWDPAPPPDMGMIEKLRKNGMQLYRAAKKPFFRERYAYQVQRLAFAGGKYREALAIYDSIGPKTQSNISERALGIQAGSFYKLKQKPEAAYRYSLLFDRGDEWRRMAFISYSWSDTTTNLILRQCKNAHERAVVQVLEGLMKYESATPEIRQALKEDPKVNGLDALVTREINKVEERLLTDMLTGDRYRTYWAVNSGVWGGARYMTGLHEYGDSAEIKKQQRLEAYRKESLELASLIEQARKGNPQRPFWTLAQAYLALITGNKTDRDALLNEAEKLKLNEREKDQLSVLKLLAVSRDDNNKITAATEKDMLPYLQWLESRRRTSARLDKTYRDFTNAYLTAMYLRQGDTVKAVYSLARSQQQYGESGMVYGVSDDFMDESGLLLQSLTKPTFDQVKNFAAKSGLSDYEEWLRGKDLYSLAVLQELEGTYFLRAYQFEEAVQAFRKSDAKALGVHMLPDPFILSINDYIEWDASDSASAITKLQFAEQMAALQGKTDAESMLKYGIGLYSMTHYGKSHRAYDYYRSGTDNLAYYADTGRRSLDPAQQQYYNPTEAEKIFVEAAAKATNPETKATALFMAAKCWQKRCPVPPGGVRYWYEPNQLHPYYIYSLQNPYFGRLKAEGSQTAFYEQAIGTCDYLRDYARRN